MNTAVTPCAGQIVGRVHTHPETPTVALPVRDALGRIVHPITVPSPLPGPDRQDLLRVRYAKRLAAQPRLQELGDRLVALGGGEPCFVHREPDLDKILARGQVFSKRCHLLRGVPNECHANSAHLWEQNRGLVPLAIVTGYALSEDGLWRQHSWLIGQPGQRWTVIETTCRRLLYYGVVLTDQEAAHHADCNFL